MTITFEDSDISETMLLPSIKGSCIGGKLVINGETVAEGVKVWTIQHDGVHADGKKVWPRDPSPRERG